MTADKRDNTPLFLALAAVGAGVWLGFKYPTTDLEAQLAKCHAEFEGFKNGVIYRK
jgi:hypothetical protein